MSMFAPFSFPAVTYGMMCFSFRFTLHVQVCRPWQNQTQAIFFPIRRLVTQSFSKFWSTAENKIENARLCPLSLHLVRIFSGQHVAGGSFEEFQHGLISNEGEFVTSTTTCAPVIASVKPSLVIELMPWEGDAATTSWPPERRRSTTLPPMRPLPPRMTIFIFLFLVSDVCL